MPNDYPAIVPLFPLAGTILLPSCILPLNIFEPRYKQMLEDAIKQDKVIGMIQPMLQESHELYSIGCLGKIDTHQELPNGNYMIRLQGLSRFVLSEEIISPKMYRTAKVDYHAFNHDVFENDCHSEKEHLFAALKNYLTEKKMQMDWKRLETIPLYYLVNILCMHLDFSHSEKQALLESPTIQHRYEDLCLLLKMVSPMEFQSTQSSQLIN